MVGFCVGLAIQFNTSILKQYFSKYLCMDCRGGITLIKRAGAQPRFLFIILGVVVLLDCGRLNTGPYKLCSMRFISHKKYGRLTFV